jgi:3-isopropylmalate dehydratase small subunit
MVEPEGRIWMFGDDVNTDLIIPGRYLDSYNPAHLASHAMEGLRKDFASRVNKGDIIVAGSNFGCGSSREQAVIALKHSGISAVVARSFARIFYRNAVNLGLLVVISPDANTVFADGEHASLDLGGLSLSSGVGGKKAAVEQPPEHVLGILRQGGLVPYIKNKLRNEVALSGICPLSMAIVDYPWEYIGAAFLLSLIIYVLVRLLTHRHE